MRKLSCCGILLAWAANLGIPRAEAQDGQTDPGHETVGKPAPELMAAGWVGSPVTLGGVKGNTVVLAFWNCDTTWFGSPEYFLQSLMEDYSKYSRTRNITCVSICMSLTATLKQVEKYIEQYRVKPLPTMLDAGGATARAYKVPKNYWTWIVVIDGTGKILYNRNKGWQWAGGPQAGRMVHHTMIEESQRSSPGILGRETIPAGGEQLAHLYDLQQFQLLEAEIKKADAGKPPDEIKGFTSFLGEKIAQTRKNRLEEIQDLSKSSPIRAYREAVAFVAAFPACPERSPMNELGKGLLKDSTVRKELQAEDAYRRILLPELLKAPKASAEFNQRIQPAVDSYVKAYGTTEYASAVLDRVETYKLAITRTR